MNRNTPDSLGRYLKSFLWLEFKRISRFNVSLSSQYLFYFFSLSLLSLSFLNLSIYEPLWQDNLREFIIGILLILFLGLFFLTILNSIFPIDETGVFFPANPFHFSVEDLSLITISPGKPLSWVFIGWIRTSFKSSMFCLLVICPIISYSLESKVPFINVFIGLATLFLAFQTIQLLSFFTYTIMEEVIENIIPRWRENRFSSLKTIAMIFFIMVLFGGLIIISNIVDKEVIQLEQIILRYWFLPPFNIIYIILSLFSKTWSNSFFLPSMFILILIWLMINFFFFTIIGSIDPLARLHERHLLTSRFDIYEFSLPTKIKTFFNPVLSLFRLNIQVIKNIIGLFSKDIILSLKYRLILGYIWVFMLTYGFFIFFLFGNDNLNLVSFLPAILWSYIFIFFIWKMELKSQIKDLKIGLLDLILEKWLFGMIFVSLLYLPILLIYNEIIFLAVLSLYHLIFFIGLLMFNLEKT